MGRDHGDDGYFGWLTTMVTPGQGLLRAGTGSGAAVRAATAAAGGLIPRARVHSIRV